MSRIMLTPKKYTVHDRYTEVEVIEVTAYERLQLENEVLLATLRKTQAEVEQLKSAYDDAIKRRDFWREEYAALVKQIEEQST